MSPAPDWQTSLNTAVAGVTMQVTPENVLQVRQALLTEAQRLQSVVLSTGVASDLIGPCGGDPVSKQAAKAYTQRIQVLIDQCKSYAQQLEAAGNSLNEVAKQYGYTEEQIGASFKMINNGVLA